MRGLIFIAVISLLAWGAVASTPTVAVYFDEALTMRSVDRLGPGLHTLYIVAEGFDTRLMAIEYKIDYPPGMTWVEDLDVSPLKIGTTEKGIVQAWQEPKDGFSRVVVARAVVYLDAELTSSVEVSVQPNPDFGFIRGVAAPDYRIIVAEGGTSTGRLDDRSSLRGSEPALHPAYPNPFNPVTQITYYIPERAHVRLAVYDVAGRLVTTLVDDVRKRGEHTVGWQADDLSSGVYFCRLVVGDYSENRKLMLIK
jgi:hypothetical protein